MKFQYLRAFIVLVAGLVAIILNMKTHKEVTWSLFIVLVVLIIFYFLATLLLEIFQDVLEKLEDEPEEITHLDEDEQAKEEVHVSFDEDENELE